MEADVILLRDLAYIVPLSTEHFAKAIGVSRRQLDRYTHKNCKQIPLKVMNSAKWVHHLYEIKNKAPE